MNSPQEVINQGYQPHHHMCMQPKSPRLMALHTHWIVMKVKVSFGLRMVDGDNTSCLVFCLVVNLGDFEVWPVRWLGSFIQMMMVNFRR